MREISASQITDLTKRLILTAEFDIAPDIRQSIESALNRETTEPAIFALTQILDNQRIASTNRTPICQDTGMIIVFADVGQDAHIEGDFERSIQDGARKAFKEGYLRASIVDDPLFDRRNTLDNTPAIIHTRLVPGDKVSLLITPKGFGSENMSAVRMFSPSAGVIGVTNFIVDTVKAAGSNPCPPTIVGVGIGADLERCCAMAKLATTRPIGSVNADPRYAFLESECLIRINALDIGPAGFGGRTTSLAVHIEHAPTHIAGLPVAVNIVCHALRHSRGFI